MNGSQLVAASNANEVLLLSHVIVFESRPALLSFRCLDTCVCVCVRVSQSQIIRNVLLHVTSPLVLKNVPALTAFVSNL